MKLILRLLALYYLYNYKLIIYSFTKDNKSNNNIFFNFYLNKNYNTIINNPNLKLFNTNYIAYTLNIIAKDIINTFNKGYLIIKEEIITFKYSKFLYYLIEDI